MPHTLTALVAALSSERRQALTAIRVSYERISDLTAELRYTPGTYPDETHALDSAPDIETQIRDLAASGMAGALDAVRYDGAGESGMDAALRGYPVWLIRTWYEPPRKPGRPKVYDTPRQQVPIMLPTALVDLVDAARRDESRSALVERLLRSWLADR